MTLWSKVVVKSFNLLFRNPKLKTMTYLKKKMHTKANPLKHLFKKKSIYAIK